MANYSSLHVWWLYNKECSKGEKMQKAFAPDLYLLSNFVNSDLSFLNEHRYRFNYGTSQRV